jgi:hypothetical protein
VQEMIAFIVAGVLVAILVVYLAYNQISASLIPCISVPADEGKSRALHVAVCVLCCCQHFESLA